MAAGIGPDVRRAILAAREEARRAGHLSTGLGHVLLALVADAGSPAGRVLRESGVTERAVRSALNTRTPAARSDPDPPPVAPAVDQAVGRAAQRAEELGRQTAGWEDLLLALTDEDNDATRIIERAGARKAEVRDRALFTLDIPLSHVRPPMERRPEGARPDDATVPQPEVPIVAAERVTEPPRQARGPEREGAERERSQRVFVIHGRDTEALGAIREFIRSLRLLPVEFREVEKLSDSVAPLIPDTVAGIFPYAQAVVALLTPDDVVFLHPDLGRGTDPEHEKKQTCQSRPNVFFEIGMALGVKPNETIIVQIGDVRPFSDIIGRSVLRLDDGAADVLHEFKERLRKAGCPVQDRDSDWLRPERFTRLSAVRRRPCDGLA